MPEINRKNTSYGKNIMTAQKIGREQLAMGEKLYFFTIIADILFGYCVFIYRAKCGASMHAMKHKNDLV